MNSPLSIGLCVLAVYSADGQFYPGKVISIEYEGKGKREKGAKVRFEGYGNEEVVSRHSIFPLETESKSM